LARRLGEASSSTGGGESAGGGLAASLELLARDQGEYPLYFQTLAWLNAQAEVLGIDRTRAA
jgi:acetyl esterase/lipase